MRQVLPLPLDSPEDFHCPSDGKTVSRFFSIESFSMFVCSFYIQSLLIFLIRCLLRGGCCSPGGFFGFSKQIIAFFSFYIQRFVLLKFSIQVLLFRGRHFSLDSLDLSLFLRPLCSNPLVHFLPFLFTAFMLEC